MKTILVIEDEQAVRTAIQTTLESEDFQAITAADGVTGLHLSQKHHPDLILCDVKMPEMDGYAVLQALQSHPATRTIPFIFLDSQGTHTDQRHGMEMGADDYLMKPCAPETLLRAIATRLEKQATLSAQTAEQLDLLRSSIALALPHELRTPLSGILSSVQLLRLLAGHQPQLVTIANTIQDSTERMHQLICNFLLYAELEIAAHHPQPLPPSWRTPLYDAEVIISHTAQQIAQKCDRQADLHLTLHNEVLSFDGPKLQKILQEIIHNACKFSPPGTPIAISSQTEARHFVITITDQGRGMTADQIANLGAYVQFERHFYEQQGSGLGLTIAKRLLELSNGILAITSTPGRQTTVKAMFPIARLDL